MSYRPITDVWILARPKVKYYGAYPSGFLHRARELLGVTISDPMLHVCGGRSRDYHLRGFGPNDKTVDLDPELKPDFLIDVRKQLPEFPGGWPAILSDPPYTEEDATKYAPGESVFPNANKLLKLTLEHVRPGGRVGMIHYLWPRPPSLKQGERRVHAVRDQLERVCQVRSVACIGVIVGFGNRMRCYSVFEREPSGPASPATLRRIKPSVSLVAP